MTTNRNRVLTIAGRGCDTWQVNESQLPDAPDNPEFEQFDPAFQDLVAARFERGIRISTFKNDATRVAVRFASRDCAKHFRDAAEKRKTRVTLGDIVTPSVVLGRKSARRGRA